MVKMSFVVRWVRKRIFHTSRKGILKSESFFFGKKLDSINFLQ